MAGRRFWRQRWQRAASTWAAGTWAPGAWAASLTLSLALNLAVPDGGAFAESLAVRAQNSRAQGMSFAGAAAGSGGLGAIFWNPASIAQMPGLQTESDIVLSNTRTHMTPDRGTMAAVDAQGGRPFASGEMGQGLLAASSYGSYQVNDDWWVGASLSSPYGFATKPQQVWAGQAYARSSWLRSTAFTPTVAYRVNDWFTLGAGVTAQYLDVTFKQAAGLSPTAPSSILSGDDFGMGFSLGATLRPRPGTLVGIGFRSMVHHELNGRWAATPGIPTPVRTGITLPETISLGITQQLNSRWNLAATGEWTNWSRLDRSAVVSRHTGLPVTSVGFRYRDGAFLSLGAEYLWSDGMTMRAGLGYERSPVTNAGRTARMSDADKVWASIGASYQATEKLGFDVGYSRQFMRQAPVRITAAHGDFNGVPFVADAKATADIISFAWHYRWDAVVPPPSLDQYAPKAY